jgi:hypothetical protein
MKHYREINKEKIANIQLTYNNSKEPEEKK